MFSSNASQVSSDANYIEDVFSTWLYTGNGTSQTITNGIDLAGKGGLVWAKSRTGTQFHELHDSVRGITKGLSSNSTASETTNVNTFTSFNSNGFTVGSDSGTNGSGLSLVSWTFREQAKFFDVVTYTGTGATGQVISHNLGSVPGCIIVKRTSGTAEWYVWHRSLTSTSFAVLLNDTTAELASGSFLTATPTSTTFSLKPPSFNPNGVNGNGSTYVAYVFAHDAGGFGLAGTDNVISCGVYTGNGTATGPVVSLGYEPQWLMIKGIDNTIGWQMIDNMRGMPVGSADAVLRANTTAAEVTADYVTPTATGFQLVSSASEVNINNGRYIYIAIRRGPMKVPTTATSVAAMGSYTGNSTSRTIGAGLGAGPVDFFLNRSVSDLDGNAIVFPGVIANRQIGKPYSRLNVTSAEATDNNFLVYPFDLQDGTRVGTSTSNYVNGVNVNYRFLALSRAPSFMDLVCYTGTGSNTSRTHNLGVAPELWIVKSRASGSWVVGSTALANTENLVLNTNAAKVTSATMWNSTYPTASVFTTGTNATVNGSGVNFVSYFFATCPGVSKVGSYIGNGATQTIDCGFTSGARMVLVKRVSGTGDWLFVYSVSVSNEQYVALNNDLDFDSANLFDINSSGFSLRNNSAVNASGETYIFLAIA